MDVAKSVYLQTWVSHTVLGLVALLAVILRFLARRKLKKTLKSDDWLILASLLLLWGNFTGDTLEAHPHSKRMPFQELPINERNTHMRITYVSALCCASCELTARVSVVLLYYRLFSVQPWLGRCLKLVAICSVLWFMTCVTFLTFRCSPVAAGYTASIQGKCVSAKFIFLLSEAPSLALDIAVVVLPIRTIWKLSLPMVERIGIVAIFTTSSFVVITQAIRLAVACNMDKVYGRDLTALTSLSFWTGFHLSFAVLCACLPVFRVYMPKENSVIKRKISMVYQYVSTFGGRNPRKGSTRPRANSSLPSFVHHDASLNWNHGFGNEVLVVKEADLESNDIR